MITNVETWDVTVANVEEQTRQSKKTGKYFNVYTIHDKYGAKIDAGFRRPKVDIGETYTMELAPGSYGNDYKLVRINTTGSGTYPSLKPKGPAVANFDPNAGGGANTNSTHNALLKAAQQKAPQFPVDLQSKDMSICRQSALKAAVDTISNMPLTFPKKSEDILDFAEEVIIPLAYKYAEFSTGHREMRMAKQQSNAVDMSGLLGPSTDNKEEDGDESC
ncbi:MAG: hypothetical protein D6711_03355 [Chloroflexi bacterium]|nr:MAG: hypothetical protein D6711_03355 [Chloroflexota bacterium]